MFQALAAQIPEIESQAIANSSARTYNACIDCYEKEMTKLLGTEPMPITLQKIQVYLLFKKQQGRTYSTLSNYIWAFSNYFRARNA